MPENVRKGVPVSAAELGELQSLQKLFASDASLKALDDFSVWIFAGAGTLGALAAVGKVTSVGGLTGEGRDYFTWATVLFGVALGLAVLARVPQPARYNPNSTLSMRKQLHRILFVRYLLATLAGFALAAAMILGGLAPLQNPHASATQLTYQVDARGAIKATLDVHKARPFSLARISLRIVSHNAVAPRPRAAKSTDGSGYAQLKLQTPPTKIARLAILRGSWLTPDGGLKTKSVVIRPQ